MMMKTFKEFNSPEHATTDVAKKSEFPTFNEAMKEGKSCMSESVHSKLNEMCENMMSEMKSCHEDETENTAEGYMSEAEGKMTEMLEALKAHCNECMK